MHLGPISQACGGQTQFSHFGCARAKFVSQRYSCENGFAIQLVNGRLIRVTSEHTSASAHALCVAMLWRPASCIVLERKYLELRFEPFGSTDLARQARQLRVWPHHAAKRSMRAWHTYFNRCLTAKRYRVLTWTMTGTENGAGAGNAPCGVCHNATREVPPAPCRFSCSIITSYRVLCQELRVATLLVVEIELWTKGEYFWPPLTLLSVPMLGRIALDLRTHTHSAPVPFQALTKVVAA